MRPSWRYPRRTAKLFHPILFCFVLGIKTLTCINKDWKRIFLYQQKRMNRCGPSDCWWAPKGGWTKCQRRRSSLCAVFDCWPSRGGSNYASRRRWTVRACRAEYFAWTAPEDGRGRGMRTPALDWWRCRPNRVYATSCSAGKRPSSTGGCCSWWAKGVPRTAVDRREFGSVLRRYTTPFVFQMGISPM